MGEGDCDGNSQCESGLQCRQDVGASYGFRPTTMCAKPPPGAGRTGTWTTVGMRGCRVGRRRFDGSGECQSGLQCRQDVGASYGFPAAYDVCE